MVAHNALRLPGSINTKPGVNRPCKLLWIKEERRYTLDDFAPFAEAVPQRVRNRAPPDPINPALIQVVIDRLMTDYGGFIQPNGWIGALCPAGHACDSPGQHFALHPSGTFGVCLGRHHTLKLTDLCKYLNINPAHYGGVYNKSTERTPLMAKKKSRKQQPETVILLTLPDPDSRNGTGTLTVKRGDLGHIQAFQYKGLTLQHTIAEVVKAALAKLTELETAPAPSPTPENMPSEPPVDDIAEEEEVEDTPEDESDALDDEDEPESPAPALATIVPTASSHAATAPTDNQQMSLF